MILKRVYTKKEFFSLILGMILTIAAFVLFAGNNNNPDYQNYYNMYWNGEVSVQDGLLKTILSLIFMKCGIPYQVFYGFLAVISFYFIWKTINYYSTSNTISNSIAFVLYMIYPFLLDIVQIDNTLAYVIVLYGLRYLDEDIKTGMKRYITVVLVASLIHPISLIYLIFLLKYIDSEKKLTTIVIAIFITLFVGSAVLIRVIPYIPLLNRFSTQIGYYVSWASEFNLNLTNGMYMYVVLMVTCYVISCAKYRQLIHVGLADSKATTTIRLMLLVICLVPLLRISSEFTRVVRNMWILYYCFWLCNKKTKLQFVFFLFAVVISIFLFLKDLGPGTYYYERVTEMIFGNNIFF